MKLAAVVKKEDIEFYVDCQKEVFSKGFFEKVKYDKTYHERNHKGGSIHCKEVIDYLKPHIAGLSGVVAARVTGSAPAGICGVAIKDVKEKLVGGNKFIFKDAPLEKAPDIDFEIIVLKRSFVESLEYIDFLDVIRRMDKYGLRVSLGFLDVESISTLNTKNVLRFGFVRNEIIITGSHWYKKESQIMWDYMHKNNLVPYYVSLLGSIHLIYAIKNSIKYGRAKSYVLTKTEHPKTFGFYQTWESTRSDLFLKEDFV
jgi:hypothetical protein